MSELDTAESLRPGDVVMVGVPWDVNSSFIRGPALAPPRIRAAFRWEAANLCTEDEHQLAGEKRLRDVGDLALENDEKDRERIERGIADLLERDVRVLSLGGDHAVSYPIVRAFGERHGPLNVVQLDAHPDLYEELDGNRYSHACPFARIQEEGLAKRLVQVGIRTMTPHQREQATRYGVEVVSMREWEKAVGLELDGPVYLSVDLDALDPAFAPGLSHPEPGGLSTRELLRVIQGLKGTLVGADIVELNPEKDRDEATALVAAKILKEIVGRMLD